MIPWMSLSNKKDWSLLMYFFFYELCSFVIFIVSWNCTNKVIQWSCVHPISFDYINHLFTLYAQVLHHWNLMIQTPHHNYYPKQIISMIQMLETLLSRHIIVIIAVTIHNDGVHGFNDQSIICVYIYIYKSLSMINQSTYPNIDRRINDH